MLVIAVVALLLIAACNQLAPKVGVASPLILLGLGIAIGFLPMVGAIEVEPEIVLEVVLPPLLFGAAVAMPVMDFRRELLAVAGLAVGLVVVSAVVLGVVIHAMVPEVSLPWAIALGAVLSPTDAVAVAIAKGLGVSHRITTILEGEGMFNDATALVLLSSATAAGLMTDSHALEPGSLAQDFVGALAVAVVVGWAVGEVATRVSARISDPTANSVISFTIPFLASVPAEHLGGSGLVAAVVAGLVGSLRAPALVPPTNRRAAQHNWRTLELVLEGGIFLAMGLQAYGIVHEVQETTGGLMRATVLALVTGAMTVVLRAAFVAPLLTWLRHLRIRSKKRYERTEERMAAFEARLSHASDIDDEVLAARNLTQEEWSQAMHRWRRRLEHRRRRQRRARNDLDYFLGEPPGRRGRAGPRRARGRGRPDPLLLHGRSGLRPGRHGTRERRQHAARHHRSCRSAGARGARWDDGERAPDPRAGAPARRRGHPCPARRPAGGALGGVVLVGHARARPGPPRHRGDHADRRPLRLRPSATVGEAARRAHPGTGSRAPSRHVDFGP